jgi:chromosome segregation ATPase
VECAARQESIAQAEKENKRLEKEVERLRKDLKKEEAELNKKDLRANKIQEEIDKIKAGLQRAKQSPDQGEARKRLSEGNKGLELQIQELFHGVKKQLALVDLLKREKVHLISAQLFKFVELNFGSSLEMQRH